MERLTKEKAKALVLRTVRLFLDNNMFVYSGNATLFIITAAFPFIMLIIAIINLVPWYSPADVSDVLLQLLPDLGQVRELLESMMSNLRNQSGGLLASAAALTTLWSASGGVNAIRVGLNQFDDAEKEKGVHNILKRLVFTLMMVILIPALLVFNMLGSSVLNVVNSILERIGIEGLAELEETLASVFHVSNLIVAGVGLLAVLMLYAYLPITRHSLKSRLPGAVFTGVIWFLFTKIFSFAIPRFYRASSLYGSLASLFLVLLWVRVIMMILFAGGALNKALEAEGIDTERLLRRRK